MSHRLIASSRAALRHRWNGHASLSVASARLQSLGGTTEISPFAKHWIHSSSLQLEKHKIQVPTMGDAITEGTIVEWVAEVGQAVQPDDVVVLVETDKVTIDIKADYEGVITAHFGAVDDNIEVGADLYEIDSEATATVVAGESPSAEINAGDASGESEAVVAASETKTESSKSSHRVPSIKFLGKEGWAKRLSPSTAADASSSDGQPPVIYGDIPPNFGRPVFTEEEMDALVQGGANLAPEVREHSGGALFG